VGDAALSDNVGEWVGSLICPGMNGAKCCSKNEIQAHWPLQSTPRVEILDMAQRRKMLVYYCSLILYLARLIMGPHSQIPCPSIESPPTLIRNQSPPHFQTNHHTHPKGISKRSLACCLMKRTNQYHNLEILSSTNLESFIRLLLQ
jgi:hypothetical protein